MDKEKEIEDMAEVIREENERMFVYHDGYVCTPIDQAKTLNNAGYGNVKQAVKEFAEKVKAEVNNLPKTALSFSVRREAPMLIDLVYKELYGADE